VGTELDAAMGSAIQISDGNDGSECLTRQRDLPCTLERIDAWPPRAYLTALTALPSQWAGGP
jgi:hypothetical protein